MKRISKIWPMVALSMFALAVSVQAAEEADKAPRSGDKAPDFTLMGSDGKEHTLSKILGDQGAVLAWFPMAFTPG